MKKITAIALSLALSASLTVASLATGSTAVHASASKEWVQLTGHAMYYGEVKNGVPHGRGTIKWGDGKQYSGDFSDGKRTGTGKYMNEYVSEGHKIKVVYSGAWKNDKMEGKGTLTHKVTDEEGRVVSHQIQTGIFKNHLFKSGYDVIHAVADPDYSFTYKNGNETLYIMGHNKDMKASWKSGKIFMAKYQKGSVSKTYSFFPGETKAEERKNAAALKYLQSIQARVNPHLEQFERLSKQLPLE